MANSRRQTDPQPKTKDFRSLDDIDRGIEKFKKRIAQVQALDPRSVRYDGQLVKNARDNILTSILEVFGAESPEYLANREFRFFTELGMLGDEFLQGEFTNNVPQAVLLLENLIEQLEEKRADLGRDRTSLVRAAFEGLDLHPRIASVSASLYRDGHYRNAVLDASVALVNLVKEKSRRHDLDGSALMTSVFSKNKPILVFNDLKDKTDEDEQEGMMHLFVGAVLALRNTRAHALLDDSPEMALEYIALISPLAKKLEQARRSPDVPQMAVASGQAPARQSTRERDATQAETCPRCQKATWRLEDSKPDPTFGVLGVTRRMYKCSECGLSEPKLSR